MALIACIECEKQISDSAPACPHCGVKAKPQKKPASPIIKYGLILAVMGGIGSSLLAPQSAQSITDKSAHDDIDMAEVTCQMAAEKSAKDPGSIQWLRGQRRFGYTNADKTLATSLQPMRAKNSYGALALIQVQCTLKKSDNQWQVIKLSE